MSATHDPDNERCLIGGLLDGGDVFEALDLASSSDFYDPIYGRIYDAIAAVVVDGKTVSTVSVAQRLTRDGSDITRQRLEGIVAEARNQMDALHTATYALTVRDAAKTRRLEQALMRALHGVKDPSKNPAEKLDTVQAELLQLSASSSAESANADMTVGGLALQELHHARSRKGDLAGLPWGVSDLDDMTGGLLPGLLYIIAGRPSMGKTWLSLMPVWHVVKTARKHVLVISLEMSRSQIAQRLVGQAAKLAVDDKTQRRYTEGELRRFRTEAEKLDNDRIIVEDSSSTGDLTALLARARQIHHRLGLDLIVVDYLQLVNGTAGRYDTRNNEISAVSRALKMLAGQLNVPVIALSQLSRAVEARPNKRPMLSDLRESGGIEQDADAVLLLYRDEYYDPNTEAKGVAEIIFAKQRSGPVGTTKVKFDVQTGHIGALAWPSAVPS